MGKIAIDFKTGTVKKEHDLIVGIDLGTTNSLIAIVKNGQAEVLTDDNDSHLLVPSIIHIDQNGHLVIGDKAKENLISDPQATIYSVKRLLGKSYLDLNERKHVFGYTLSEHQQDQIIKVKVNDKFYSPIELSSYILSYLKSRAEKKLNQPISKAVITVPAYFNDAQRQATRDAGKLAGLEVLRIVNEPTAASLAYGIGLNKDETKNIVVYDLGGGTFDISILRIENGIFEVLSTHGDTYLGGDDIDQNIIKFWSEKYQFPIPTDPSVMNELRLIAEHSKIELSNKNQTSSLWNTINLELSHQELMESCSEIIDKTINGCIEALKDSGLSKSDISDVLMVGGSTKMPYIKKRVTDFFEMNVNDTINPDEVVALGAAIQADILAGNRKDLLLLDINPLSLGIETLGGLMDVIIPRNSKIPISQARQYTTSKDGQINLKIAVYQGERELVANNRKLAEFILNNIPPMPAGFPKIEVRFLIDADGILTVKALELRSGLTQSIDIKSQFAIPEAEMAQMLKESILFAQSDQELKGLIDVTNEANSIILNSQKFIKNHAALMSEDQVEQMKLFIAALEDTITLKDKNKIQTALNQLNEFATPIAHIAMDQIIQDALQGKTI